MKNYYRVQAGDIPSRRPLAESFDLDVCVVGGGLAGLATAMGLVERGCSSVAIVEAQHIGYGASGRNGGFVFSGYSRSLKSLYRELGHVKAKRLYQLSTDAVNLIRQRIKRYRIDCDFNDSGVLWANWFKDAYCMPHYAQWLKENFEVEWRYISKADIRNYVISERYTDALLEENAFQMHALKYCRTIANVLEKAGLRIFENSPAMSMAKRQGGGYSVKTPHGEIRCQQLVICSGAYDAHHLAGARAILPISTIVAVSETCEDVSNFIRSYSPIYDNRFAFDYYRRTLDGRLLWGGRIAAGQYPDTAIRTILRRDMAKVFPGLAQLNFEFAWGGLMAYARHQMPCIAQVAPGIWINNGYGGHGLAPTTVGGELIAAAIVGQDEGYRDFARWKPVWAGGALGLVAAQAQYYYLQAKDAFNDWRGA